MEWEQIGEPDENMFRTEVPGGWLYGCRGLGMAFVPDNARFQASQIEAHRVMRAAMPQTWEDR